MANPDFIKIKESNFEKYYYESFIETYKRYLHCNNSFNVFLKGIEEKLFVPQFHGREHLNINLWLKLLKENRRTFIKAFDYGFWGIGPLIEKNENAINIQASFDASNIAELLGHELIIREGLQLFEGIFRFKSSTFIANNFIWDSSINKELLRNGVTTFQGMKYQLAPIFGDNNRKKSRHYLGEKNDLGQKQAD
jgi:hypothetical protein